MIGPAEERKIETLRVYGIAVRTEARFRHRVLRTTVTPEIALTTADTLAGRDETRGRCVFTSLSKATSGAPALTCFLDADGYRLVFGGEISFHVSRNRVVRATSRPHGLEYAENCFLGAVMAFVLEERGVPALHAAGVVLGGRCTAFLARGEMGKTSLAAEFVRAGAPLVTDDILPAGTPGDPLRVRTGFPTMRMWPSQADRFVGGHQHLPRVHPLGEKRLVFVGEDGFGTFREEPLPLGRIYVPDRREGGPITIESLPPHEAFSALLRYSFLPTLVEALGWQPRRMPVLARIAREVPMKRLVYPSGFEHLPRVREAILEDLARDS